MQGIAFWQVEAPEESNVARMNGLKTTHFYHDAIITEIRYRDEADIIIDVALCSCCNPSNSFATLKINDVRNFTDIRTVLEATRESKWERGHIDEIIGISKEENRGYLLDLMIAGPIRLFARSFHEI